MYQITVRIEGFVTVESDRKLTAEEIPVSLEAVAGNFDRGAGITQVESDIVAKEVQGVVEC